MKNKYIEITKLMPKNGKGLLMVKGTDFVQQVGIQTVKEVIHEVLCGENLRNSTEKVTRKRISIANGALLLMFLEGCKQHKNFAKLVLKFATVQLQKKGLSKEDKWILNWMLGLTGKAVQNILRDDSKKLESYMKNFTKTIEDSAKTLENEFGQLKCEFVLSKKMKETFDWEKMLLLFSAIGAQTLTIRGAEKSTYGKLFERLVLGSLLHILDFKLVDPKTNKNFRKVFWFSERADKRESDATLIYELGKGVRFDIGFIGRGNPEISLDKVSRFEKEIEYGRHKHFIATFIIVDRIGRNSRIERMAQKIDGTIVQMSMSYWPKIVAEKLREKIGYNHEILKIKDEDLSLYIIEKLKDAPLEKFLKKL